MSLVIQGSGCNFISQANMYIMEQKDIGTVIKEIRLRSGLSQVELSEISGLSLRSIQRIENNNTIPRGDSLKRLAEALKVNIEELTGSIQLKNVKSVTPLKEVPKSPLILSLIRLQLVCLAILILVYLYLFTKKFFGVNLPLPINPKPAIMFLWAMNVVNVFVLLFILAIKWTRTPKSPLILNLIRLQLVCFAILILVYVYLFTKKFFGVNLPLPINPKPAIMFLWAMNVINVFVLLFSVVIKWMRTPKEI